MDTLNIKPSEVLQFPCAISVPAPFRPTDELFVGPGPIRPSEAVQAALSRLEPSPGTEDVGAMQDELRAMLSAALGTPPGNVTIVAGSGSMGIESALQSLLGLGATAVICNNGAFSARMVDMAKRTGATVHELTAPWGESVSAQQLDDALRGLGKVDLVGLVHGETSTGALADASALGAVAHEYGALALVDCVATMFGHAMTLSAMNADVLCGAGQKCLAAYPGLSPLALSDAAMERLRTRNSETTSWNMHLAGILTNGVFAKGFFRMTPSVVLMRPLHEALREVLTEGVASVAARHIDANAYLRAGFESLGLRVRRGTSAMPQVVVLELPAAWNPKEAASLLRARHRLIPGLGLGDWGGQVWRIGVMGTHANRTVLDKVLLALADVNQAIRAAA